MEIEKSFFENELRKKKNARIKLSRMNQISSSETQGNAEYINKTFG